MIKKAFITKSNLNSIVTSLEEIEQLNSADKTALYKYPIYFLHKNEIDRLLKQREFLKDPENVFKIYKKKKSVDSKKYIFEGAQPAYHTRTDCKNLNSKFNNYEIPLEIQEKGDAEIDKFRKWFKSNQVYLSQKPGLFSLKLQIAFGLSNIPFVVEHDNSGLTELDNLNLNDLEERIDSIIKAAGTFYKDNPDKQTIIKRFQKLTFLAYTKNEIKLNDTNYTDDDLKSFLYEYDVMFKKPFKDLLLQYLMVKYNPELKFNGLLLEQLNFKKCHKCQELDVNQQTSQ